MGSGGVAVSAYAYAKGNQAGAGATCSGAANCTANYFAEAHDSATRVGRPDLHDGRWPLRREQVGALLGQRNGGCGVTAVAVPRDPDGGEAYCTGDCGNFAQGGKGGVFTVTVASIENQLITAGRAGRERQRRSSRS